MHGQRPDATVCPDQEMLNTAPMATEFPMSPVENSNTDFALGGYIMSHAVGRAKPYIFDAILGYPPEQWQKLFWRSVIEPIAVMRECRTAPARVSLRFAASIDRFCGRR